MKYFIICFFFLAFMNANNKAIAISDLPNCDVKILSKKEGYVRDFSMVISFHQCWAKITDEMGDIYIGEFLNQLFHGQGNKYYGNGNVYSGQWKEGGRHGFGEFNWDLGDKYIGNWNLDERNGFGT